jgi:uncharacterized protein
MIEPGSTAVVTGASSGIGEQFARQLATRGVNLVLVARNQVRLQSLADQLKTAHPDVEVTVIPADLSVPSAAAELAEKLATAEMTVDMLVNNAGFGSHDLFVDEDPDNVAREIQLNCGSVVALTARLLPGMLARGRGGVLNVASTSAFQPVPTMAVYAASKAFVLSFTEALWEETRGSGVRILALCPGATKTRFFENMGTELKSHGRQTPEHVAAAGLRAFDSGRGPSVVSGLANRMFASGYRIMPRAAMVRLARPTVQPAPA